MNMDESGGCSIDVNIQEDLTKHDEDSPALMGLSAMDIIQNHHLYLENGDQAQDFLGGLALDKLSCPAINS